jgi:hypothetical protein
MVMKKSENTNVGRPPEGISEEDLARSAEARREPTNRFGMRFREMQLDTFRAMLEREGSDEGLFEAIQKPR